MQEEATARGGPAPTDPAPHAWLWIAATGPFLAAAFHAIFLVALLGSFGPELLRHRDGVKPILVFLGSFLALAAFLLWLFRSRATLAQRPRPDRIKIIACAWSLVAFTWIAGAVVLPSLGPP